MTEADVWPAFVERVLSFVDVDAIKPLRIVIDAANGMAGAMLPPVLERLPIEAVSCFFEPDGTFPNHEPNPLLPENREFIMRKTLEEQADFGVAFDGDADRCFFVDDTGEFVPGDFATTLFAESILAKEPGGKIIYDVRASWAVPETVERAGGVPLVNRVGHAFIKHRMRTEDAVFGGEVSGHYYFRDFFQADSGVVPFLLMPSWSHAPASRSPRSCAPTASATSSPARSTRPSTTCPSSCRSSRSASSARVVSPPRRHLRGGRGLALQRTPVEHGAAAAAEPRSADAGADGAEARRGARRDLRDRGTGAP